MNQQIITILLFFCLFSGAVAQTPVRVTDINPSFGHSFPEGTVSDPIHMMAWQGKMYFSADDDASGKELWVYDPATNQTTQLKDINPGAGSGDVSDFFIYKDRLYFNANDNVSGKELWSTDGTTNGTKMVIDLYQGAGSGNPKMLYRDDTTMYMRGLTGASQGLIFRFNGVSPDYITIWTTTNPSMLNLTTMLPFNGRYYYCLMRTWVWSTDGSMAGTQLEFSLGAVNADMIHEFATPYNGKLIFTGETQDYGIEPWISDGTSAGTMILKDIHPAGTNDGGDKSYTPYDGKIYFGSPLGLFQTDGTPDGTVNIKSGRYYYPIVRDDHNMYLFMQALDPFNGPQLVRSDGTTDGTIYLTDTFDLGPQELMVAGNNRIFFSGNLWNRELWYSDGTVTGTYQIEDINPDDSSNPSKLTMLGNTLYFIADNGAKGRELWRLDLTSDTHQPVSTLTDFMLSPNPVSDNLTIQFSAINEPLVARIYTMQGQLIRETSIAAGLDQTTLSVAQHKPGQYVLELINPKTGAKKAEKLLIQR